MAGMLRIKETGMLQEPQTKEAEDLSDLERPAFPEQFINIMKDYAYETLSEYLKAQNASEDALHLLDDLVILADLREMIASGKDIEYHWNVELQECISGITHAVDAMGGIFSGPYGEARSGK
jgi:hypothetical protein